MNESNYICHYGVKNQRWGDRKYQYRDGSLTPEGRRHYGVGEPREGTGESSSNKKKLTDEERTQMARTKSARYQAQADEMDAKTRYLKSKKEYDKTNRDEPERQEPVKKRDATQDEIEYLRKQKELLEARTEFIKAQKALHAAEITPKEESEGKKFIKELGKEILTRSVTTFEDYAFDRIKKALYPTTDPPKSKSDILKATKAEVDLENQLKESTTKREQYSKMTSDEIWAYINRPSNNRQNQNQNQNQNKNPNNQQNQNQNKNNKKKH